MKRIIPTTFIIIVFLTIFFTHALFAAIVCSTEIEEENNNSIYLNNNYKLNCYSDNSGNTIFQLLSMGGDIHIQLNFNKESIIKTLFYSNNKIITFKELDFINPTIKSYIFPKKIRKLNNEIINNKLTLEEFILVNKLLVFIQKDPEIVTLNIFLQEKDFIPKDDFSCHVVLEGNKIEKISYYIKKTESLRYVFYDQNADGIIDYITTLKFLPDGTHKILRTTTKDEFIRKKGSQKATEKEKATVL